MTSHFRFKSVLAFATASFVFLGAGYAATEEKNDEAALQALDLQVVPFTLDHVKGRVLSFNAPGVPGKRCVMMKYDGGSGMQCFDAKPTPAPDAPN